VFDLGDTTCEGTLDCNKEEDNNAYSFYGLVASTTVAVGIIGYGLYSCTKASTLDSPADSTLSTIERLKAAGIAKEVM
jgi:hypothetical protein